jgi:hypothetical protein
MLALAEYLLAGMELQRRGDLARPRLFFRGQIGEEIASLDVMMFAFVEVERVPPAVVVLRDCGDQMSAPSLFSKARLLSSRMSPRHCRLASAKDAAA